MKHVFILDNLDSFTYNLAHSLEAVGAEVVVSRWSESIFESINSYDAIVLSPGPGLPKEAHGLMRLLSRYFKTKPILGVCLGMQALIEFTDGALTNMPVVKHGVSENISIIKSNSIFNSLGDEIEVGLYHSWAVTTQNLPQEWICIGSYKDWVMAIKHKDLPIYALQFHPESVLTPSGRTILKNWLNTI